MEECSDYIDYRVVFREIAKSKVIRVRITKHAIKRLRERAVKEYYKFTDDVIKDIIRNIVRDGYYKVFTDKILIWTRKYLLVCELDREFNLIVKTVISRDFISDKLKGILSRGVHYTWSKVELS